jgi:hypothetical protein
MLGLEATVGVAGPLHACVGLKYGARVILNTGQSVFSRDEKEQEAEAKRQVELEVRQQAEAQRQSQAAALRAQQLEKEVAELKAQQLERQLAALKQQEAATQLAVEPTAVVPEPAPAELTLDEWLVQIKLDRYGADIKEAGYDEFEFLKAADEADVEEILGDISSMKKPHAKAFMREWKKLVGSQTSSQHALGLPPAAAAPHPAAPALVVQSHGQMVELHQTDEFDFVFSNKTATDALCLAVRSKLTELGLKVWQQKTNIPKDSDNWFTEWYPSAISASKIVCFITVDYVKSPFCMKEFVVAKAKGKLLVVACEPLAEIAAVDARQFPHASDCLAFLDTGGQVICPRDGLSWDGAKLCGDEDVVAQILKFRRE